MERLPNLALWVAAATGPLLRLRSGAHFPLEAMRESERHSQREHTVGWLVHSAQEGSQNPAVGWKEKLRQTVDCSSPHLGESELAFQRNQSVLPRQGSIPKAGQEMARLLLAAGSKRGHHNWGSLCCQAAKGSHIARSGSQTYWTSPGLPFFNQSVMMTKRVKIIGMIALL